MKKNLLSLSILLLSAVAGMAQSYNSPESIEFDYANNRWLIANNSGNNILQRNSATGAVTLFAACSGGPHGIEIVNDTLYVNAGGSIKLFNINTAAQIGTIAMGATFLNGLTHDNTYLYSTDFTAKKIYRINIATRAFSVFVTSTVSTPNGIVYDAANNRCIFVNWGSSAPIKAMDVTTGAITTVATTTLGNCDGITMDGAGNYYVTSWTGNKITRFNNSFGSPTTVVTGLSNPAEIFYNVLTDTLGNCNSGTLNNTTYHYFGSTTGIAETPASALKFSVFPNPVVKTAEINYELKTDDHVMIQLFDVKGTLVKTVADERQPKGIYTTFLSRTGLAAGTYMLTIKTAAAVETKKIIITE